ncbi:MAG: PPOX class F420-dependent oxidoreductase [Deltaproteobacteria bacterium]
MMQKMTESERREFLLHGTRTAKLATVGRDGCPRVTPVWFDLDGDTVVFTTGGASAKAANMRRNSAVSICVDDETPPFAFVRIDGVAEVIDNPDPQTLLYWTTRIGGRYMGADLAEAYGRRNGVPGEVLVRVKPERITSLKGIAD